jgi:hypothetical protein
MLKGIIKQGGFLATTVIYSHRIFTIFPSGRDRTVKEGIIKHAGFFQLQL